MRSNPFYWEPDRVATVGDNKPEFVSVTDQRNASYTEPAQEVFETTQRNSFMENKDAPTPQIKEVCGIECGK